MENEIAKRVAASPMNKSAHMMTAFRLIRSTQTPANGPNINCGRNASKPANDIINGDSVSLANHHISENCTALLPMMDMVCPPAMVRNLFFQALSPGRLPFALSIVTPLIIELQCLTLLVYYSKAIAGLFEGIRRVIRYFIRKSPEQTTWKNKGT
jgi:hypothetical protein